jgi:hypothetical protein
LFPFPSLLTGPLPVQWAKKLRAEVSYGVLPLLLAYLLNIPTVRIFIHLFIFIYSSTPDNFKGWKLSYRSWSHMYIHIHARHSSCTYNILHPKFTEHTWFLDRREYPAGYKKRLPKMPATAKIQYGSISAE